MDYYRARFTAKHFIRQQTKRKSFWILLFMPALPILLAPLLPKILSQGKKAVSSEVVILYQPQLVNTANYLSQALAQPSAMSISNSGTKAELRKCSGEIARDIEELETQVLRGDVEAFIVVETVNLEDKQAPTPTCTVYISMLGMGQSGVVDKIQTSFSILHNLEPNPDIAKGTSIDTSNVHIQPIASQLDRAIAEPVDGQELDVDTQKAKKLFAMASIFICFMGVRMAQSFVARPMYSGLMKEKQEKTIETLLTAYSVEEIIFGRLLGCLILGVAVTAFYVGPIMLINLYLGSLTAYYFLLLFAFALLELVLFSCCYFLCGCVAATPEEAARLTIPIELFWMLGPILFFSIVSSPDSMLATVCSLVPFLMTAATPIRSTLASDVSYLLPSGAFLILLLLTFLAIRFCYIVVNKEMLIFNQPFSFGQLWRRLRKKKASV